MKVEIEKLDDLGRGICFIDGKITFVPKTIPGDIVKIEIVISKKNYNEGKVLKIISPSEIRIKAPCPYFDVCGGCDLQNLSYEDTIKYKKAKVIDLFKRNKIEINPIFIENPSPFKYRNKITLKVVDKKIGYYKEKSHQLIEIDECLIASSAINKVIPIIKDLNIINGEVTIRSNYNEEVLIIIETLDKLEINIEKLKTKIKLAGIVLNGKAIYNESFLYEVINGLIYRVSYDSFFQVNPNVASEMFKIIKNNTSKEDKVLELYSGVGALSLNASLNASKVIGVEIVPNAVLNAIFNARINKLNNTEFILNDATKAVEEINVDFNKLIVDPPRAGLSKNVINMILRKLPESIIYVSCDMHTLVRDIKLLNDKYDIVSFYTLDMFSYTYHVENICVLSKK